MSQTSLLNRSRTPFHPISNEIVCVCMYYVYVCMYVCVCAHVYTQNLLIETSRTPFIKTSRTQSLVPAQKSAAPRQIPLIKYCHELYSSNKDQLILRVRDNFLKWVCHMTNCTHQKLSRTVFISIHHELNFTQYHVPAQRSAAPTKRETHRNRHDEAVRATFVKITLPSATPLFCSQDDVWHDSFRFMCHMCDSCVCVSHIDTWFVHMICVQTHVYRHMFIDAYAYTHTHTLS